MSDYGKRTIVYEADSQIHRLITMTLVAARNALAVFGMAVIVFWPISYFVSQSITFCTYEGPWKAEVKSQGTFGIYPGVMDVRWWRNQYTTRDWTTNELSEMKEYHESIKPNRAIEWSEYTYWPDRANRAKSFKNIFRHILSFRFYVGPGQQPTDKSYTGPERAIQIKLPVWAVAFASFGVRWMLGAPIRKSALQHQRTSLGLCQMCGYDIRNCEDKCPECGSQIVVHQANA